MKLRLLILAFLTLILISSSVSANLVLTEVISPDLLPGQEGRLIITIENNFDEDAEDVSLSLDLRNVPITIVGSAETTLDEIREDREEDFIFNIRASPTAEAGDYQIPYTLVYKDEDFTKTGTIGVRVEGTVELYTSTTTENAIIGQEGKINLKIINKGFADARYVTLKVSPNGYVLKSDNTVFVGDINANDYETVTFDVIFQKANPKLSGVLEYKDFNNVQQVMTINELLDVYTNQEAIEKGIIKKSNTPIYLTILVLVIVLWFVWRAIRKRRRIKQSQTRQQGA